MLGQYIQFTGDLLDRGHLSKIISPKIHCGCNWLDAEVHRAISCMYGSGMGGHGGQGEREEGRCGGRGEVGEEEGRSRGGKGRRRGGKWMRKGGKGRRGGKGGRRGGKGR